MSPIEPGGQVPETTPETTTIEERLLVLARLPGDVVVLIDLDGNTTYVSPSVTRTLGYDPAMFVDVDHNSLVHPDDLPTATSAWREVVATPDAQRRWEHRILHADGTWRWTEVVATNTLHDPAIRAVFVNFRDIHERKRAEEALRASEARFRALVQNSHDIFVVVHPEQGVVYASPTLETLFGRRVSDVLGSNPLTYIHPDDVGDVADALSGASARPDVRASLRARIRRADGTYRWVEAVSVNQVDNELIGGIVVNIRDVTDQTLAEQALRESERLFRSLAQSSPMGIVQYDAAGSCVYVNERWQEITGYHADDALGDGWRRSVHPDDQERLGFGGPAVPGGSGRTGDRGRGAAAGPGTGRDPRGAGPTTARSPGGSGGSAGSTGSTGWGGSGLSTTEHRVVRPDGAVRWVSVRTAPIYDDAGQRVGSVGAMEDVTDHVAAQRDSQRLTDIVESTHDLVAVTDNRAEVLYLNRAARRFLEVDDATQVNAFDLLARFPPDVIERLTREVQPCLDADGTWYGEIDVFRRDGTVVPHLARLLVHHDDRGSAEFYSAVLHDISERKAFEHSLAHQATHDPLTGLPNRALLLDRLAMALARARRHHRRLAVLFLDLDHFKVVNDSLGHALGDRLLITVAERLQASLRPEDTVARFGGDEFVVLCEDLTSQLDAAAVANRVNDALSGPFTVGDSEVFMDVSIGIALADDPAADAGTLIRDADAAMYRAKAQGRGRWVVFDRAMRASAVERLDIENSLRRALERHELRILYQPVVDLRSGGVVGIEALVRWEHPERGLLPPGDFIRLAEETGLIVPIGRWVLDEACHQVARWAAEIPGIGPLALSVNLSGRQLAHPGLVDDVAGALATAGLDPRQLEMEITESVLVDDIGQPAEALARLRELGVLLGVDDFGTGYSSLSYLRRFPVDVLKVDRSFVAGLGTGSADAAIVEAVVNLAHTLGLVAVGEGVERAEQLAELRRLGCDRAQGFHLARPATGPEVGELLARDPRW